METVVAVTIAIATIEVENTSKISIAGMTPAHEPSVILHFGLFLFYILAEFD